MYLCWKNNDATKVAEGFLGEWRVFYIWDNGHGIRLFSELPGIGINQGGFGSQETAKLKAQILMNNWIKKANL